MSDFICKFLWKNADVLTDFSVINRVTLRFCSLKGEKYLNNFTLSTFNVQDSLANLMSDRGGRDPVAALMLLAVNNTIKSTV